MNKQYSKEEYGAMVGKIRAQMSAVPYRDTQGMEYRYGEFFPMELSPFAYNESVAMEYFPLTREEAVNRGYRWKEPDDKEYTITMEVSGIPDAITAVTDVITRETLACEHGGTCNDHCTKAFRITEGELKIYHELELPIPRLCVNCRYRERIRSANPPELWRRTCACSGKMSADGVYTNTTSHFHEDGRCPNKFETSYEPQRPEIVYCEQCYQAEVV